MWRLEGPGREKQAQDNFKKAQEQQPHNPWIKRLASEAASPLASPSDASYEEEEEEEEQTQTNDS